MNKMAQAQAQAQTQAPAPDDGYSIVIHFYPEGCGYNVGFRWADDPAGRVWWSDNHCMNHAEASRFAQNMLRRHPEAPITVTGDPHGYKPVMLDPAGRTVP